LHSTPIKKSASTEGNSTILTSISRAICKRTGVSLFSLSLPPPYVPEENLWVSVVQVSYRPGDLPLPVTEPRVSSHQMKQSKVTKVTADLYSGLS